MEYVDSMGCVVDITRSKSTVQCLVVKLEVSPWHASWQFGFVPGSTCNECRLGLAFDHMLLKRGLFLGLLMLMVPPLNPQDLHRLRQSHRAVFGSRGYTSHEARYLVEGDSIAALRCQ